MPLIIPEKFKADIQDKNTNLVPLVLIGSYIGAAWSHIGLSTNEVFLNYLNTPNAEEAWSRLHFSPILLNIPGLKESIDIESRKYKISSVTLNISNAPYGGKSFSELVLGNAYISNSLINEEVRIFWMSSSTINVSPPDLELSDINYTDADAFQIYYGKIRRYTYDDEKITIVVEDESQDSLHLDLPKIHLPSDDSVPDKSKNNPIPMVYGAVFKSPCLISSRLDTDFGELGTSLIYENNEFSDTIGHMTPEPSDVSLGIHWWNMSPLYINENDTYISVTQSSVYHPDDNFFMQGNIIEFNLDGASDIANNGTCSIFVHRNVSKVTFAAGENSSGFDHFIWSIQDGNIVSGVVQDDYGLTDAQRLLPIDSDENTALRLDGWIDDTNVQWAYLRFEVDPILLDHPCDSYLIMKVTKIAGNECTWSYNAGLSGYTTDNIDTGELQADVDNFWTGNAEDYPLTEWTQTSDYTGFKIGIPNHHDYNWIQLTEHFNFKLDIAEAHLWQWVHIPALVTKDFYIDAGGRWPYYPGTDDEIWPNSITRTLRSPISQIIHILTHELGVKRDKIKQLEDGSPENALDVATYYSVWYGFHSFATDFTINKKINSKKLIEDISSVAPIISYFDNMGNFNSILIKSHFTWAEIYDSDEALYFDGDGLIEAKDILDYSYSKTAIEDVYTNIRVDYYWDYAKEALVRTYPPQPTQTMAANYLLPFSDSDTFAQYSPLYYNFPYWDENSESRVLHITDDRGKYIRDELTAVEFATWQLLWYCNQHLKIKLKLPLKYLDKKIGDYIIFDEIIGDKKPYGINYAYNAIFPSELNIIGDIVNGQQVFPVFMIVSTNKTLEYVEIECVQMHNLDLQVHSRDGVQGCMDAESWNYDSLANIAGNCVGMDEFLMIDDCPYEINPNTIEDAVIDPDFPPTGLGSENVDYSTNYSDAFDYSAAHIFLLEDDQVQYNTVWMHPAQKYWHEYIEGGGSYPNPQIYSIAFCDWNDTHYHHIYNVHAWIYDPGVTEESLLGVGWVDVGIVYEPGGGEAVWNYLEIQMTESIFNYLNETGTLKMTFIYNFTLLGLDENNDGIPDGPTFRENSSFLHRYYNTDAPNDPITSNAVNIVDDIYTHIGDHYTYGYSAEVEFLAEPLALSDFGAGSFNFRYSLNVFPTPEEGSGYPEIIDDGTGVLFLPFETGGTNILGDGNGDGLVNIIDIVFLVHCIMQQSCVDLFQWQQNNLDTNNDGSFNIFDIIALINYVIG